MAAPTASARLARAMRDVETLAHRRAVVRVAAGVARVGLDYLVDHRGATEHAIDVVAWWCDGDAADDGVRAARADLERAATRLDRGRDRAAWLAARAAALLAEAALEPMPDLAAKRLWEMAEATLDAMTWPECDEPATRAEAEARIGELLAGAPFRR